MARSISGRNILLAVFFASFAYASPAFCGQRLAPPVLVRGESIIAVDARGDAALETAIHFPTSLAYQETKLRFPNPFSLMRFVMGSDNRAVIRDVDVRYDDMARAVRVTCRRAGMAALRDGKWRLVMDSGTDMVHAEDGLAIFYENTVSPPNAINSIALKITLPEGAADLAYDRRTREFSYRLSRVPATEGRGVLSASLTAKENIMSAAYKMYGDADSFSGTMWAARAVLVNDGDADVTDVRIRYRIGEFADWSPEIRYDLVPPGGSLVDCYYPVFKANAMDLINPSPVYVDVEYSYRDNNGERREESAAARTRILGRTSFLFSNLPNSEAVSWLDRYANAPLLAGFVTRMDPVVREFAGMGSRASGGAAAHASDEDAVAFCRAVYDQMVANGISYQSPPSFLTETANLVQELKYPRDVLRDKAGTCIELAILYAAVCESNGLKTTLVLMPGHCFSVIELPSGQILPVENTTVLGAAVGKSGTFEQAVEIAFKELAELKPELFYFVNVRALQERGVASPELPDLPPDTLRKWGIEMRLPSREEKAAGASRSEARTEKAAEAPPRAVEPDAASAVAGIWEGRYGEKGTEYPMKLEITRRFGGKMHLLEEGIVAEIAHMSLKGDTLNLIFFFPATDSRGNRVDLQAHFHGVVREGRVEGQYGVGPKGADSPTVRGRFSAALIEAGKIAAGQKWSDMENPPAEGHLSGAWSGVYTGGGGMSLALKVEIWQSGDKYRGSLQLAETGFDGELVYISDLAEFGVVVAEMGGSVISLTGKIKKGSWNGAAHYSDAASGDSGTFSLTRK